MDEKVLCVNIKSRFSVLFYGNKEPKQKIEKLQKRNYLNWCEYDETILRITGNLSPYVSEKKTITQTNKRENSISKKSQSRIRNYVNLLLDTAIEKEIYSRKENKRFIYKIGFCTLTIPPEFDADDKTIHYKIFKPFLRVLQDKYELAEYIWKAETQENGNLHYHLTVNQWLHWYIINREWRKQIQKHGYDYGTEKRKRAATEIHSVKKVKNLAAYLSKYLCKNDEWKKETPKEITMKYETMKKENEPTENFIREHNQWRKRIPDIKLWDCSTSLKKEKLTLRNILETEKEMIKDFAAIITDEIQKDFFSLLIYDNEAMKQTKTLGKIWKDYIDRIRQPGKQKEKYEVETLKYNDDAFSNN